MLERARRLTLNAGLQNVTYELGDAQIRQFQPANFDVLISRFGTMFFADPVAAFTNLAHASRRGARLVMMVWQSAERNEWATAIPEALTVSDLAASATARREPFWQAPFALADPSVVEAILLNAGFSDVGFTEVHEPVINSAGCWPAISPMTEYCSTRAPG
jgi:ubiquinone/menaquinone biosynthesis C-methylase UbiE